MLSIMKTFLNVLYRRILYKIPLKFLLVLLAVLAVFVASTKADNVASLLTTYDLWTKTITTSRKSIYDYWANSSDNTICFNFDWFTSTTNIFVWNSPNYDWQPWANIKFYNGWAWEYLCLYKSANDRYLNIKAESSSTNVNISYFIFFISCRCI